MTEPKPHWLNTPKDMPPILFKDEESEAQWLDDRRKRAEFFLRRLQEVGTLRQKLLSRLLLKISYGAIVKSGNLRLFLQTAEAGEELVGGIRQNQRNRWKNVREWVTCGAAVAAAYFSARDKITFEWIERFDQITFPW